MTRQQRLKDYEGFVEKFKPKKTTDDCMTPPEIYEVIKDYVVKRWDINPDKVVRPFWPGADYKTFDYSDGAVVIDNLPFSILSQIVSDYISDAIPFFLFAPSLTIFGASNATRCNHIVCDADIIYQNGAVVKTSFITSYGAPTVAETDPELTKLINRKAKELSQKDKKQLPKYTYPKYVLTAAMLQKYSSHGIHYRVTADEVCYIRALDAQRPAGKAIFGSGFLLAERAAAERAAAERAAATTWELSERELEIIKRISKGGTA